VGRSVLRGFEEGAWKSSLDSAGYPSTAVPGVAPKPSPPAKDAAKETNPKDPTQTDAGKPPS
jgi:hypothetical protein